MQFIKFPSIIALHKDNNICKQRIDTNTFEITEKIDGTNFSIITDGTTVKYARRKAILQDDEKFYNYQLVMNKPIIKELIAYLKYLAIFNKTDVQLYGELFGKDIQDRINYGNDKYFNWFALRMGNEFITQEKADSILIAYKKLKVPVIDIINIQYNSCDELIIKLINVASELENNNSEGIVIKAYDSNPLFMLKYHFNKYSWKRPVKYKNNNI